MSKVAPAKAKAGAGTVHAGDPSSAGRNLQPGQSARSNRGGGNAPGRLRSHRYSGGVPCIPGSRADANAIVPYTAPAVLNHLVIPKLPEGFVESMTISLVGCHQDEWGLAPSPGIAAELLACGVLREEDWAGEFHTSINRGLARFVNEQHGGASWHALSGLAVLWTDDVERSGISDERWRSGFGATDAPIGAFCLTSERPDIKVAGIPMRTGTLRESVREIWCRRAVQAMERAAAGAGYSVMCAVETALAATSGGITFGAAYAWLYNGGLTFPRMDMVHTDYLSRIAYETPGFVASIDARDMTQVTVDKFTREVPLETHQAGIDRAAMADAIDRLECSGGSQSAKLAEAVRDAMELDILLRTALAEWPWLNHLELMAQGDSLLVPFPALLFRWSAGDYMDRIFDDWTFAAKSSSALTMISWLHGWQTGSKGVRFESHRPASVMGGFTQRKPKPDGSIAQAAEAMGVTLDILTLADRILTAIDTPPKSGQTA